MAFQFPAIEDVQNDEDLARYFKTMRKLMAIQAREMAAAAAEVSAMLKTHDQRAGVKRRHKIARPIAVNAALMILLGRNWALANRRFHLEYDAEIRGRSGRQRRHVRREITFGDR